MGAAVSARREAGSPPQRERVVMGNGDRRGRRWRPAVPEGRREGHGQGVQRGNHRIREVGRPRMLLVIDIGNTNTVLGVFDGETLIHHWRIFTDREKTSDEYGILIR